MSHVRRIIMAKKSDPNERYHVMFGDSYIWAMRRLTLSELTKDDGFVATTRLLQVRCPHPTCTAEPMQWCTLPNGRVMNALHIARWRSAYELGWWEARELTLPNV